MTRDPAERLDDIRVAVVRCQSYRHHLASPDPEMRSMAYDAVLRNLAVIGEAVRTLPAEVTAALPDIPWASIAGLRNIVVHEYFRVDPETVIDIVDNNLAELLRAIES